MAGWYRQDLADDARVAMLLTLGQTELVLAHLRITEHRVRHEDDEPPADLAHWKPKLIELNLWRTLDDLITVQLAQRARTNRSRKRDATTRDVTLRNVTTREVTATQHNTTQQTGEREITPPASAPAPAKPKRQRTTATSFDDWSPKEDHVTIAKQRGIRLDVEVSKMRDWVLSTAAKKKDWDAFARNWLRNAKPERLSPVNTGNSLRQPHPSTIPTDPDEARVYWLGEQDEPRFDFG